MIVAPFWRAPLAKRHRHVDRIGSTVLLHIEPGQHVVGARQREQVRHFLGGDLVHVDAAIAVERADPPVLLEAVGLGRQLDEADAVRSRSIARSRPRAASYRSQVYLRISVEVSDSDPNVTISPAACQVVPDVNLSRSRTTTSVQPMSAR